MSSYQVRPAIKSEAKAVAEIHAIGIAAAFEGLVPEEQINTTPLDKRQAFWRDAIEYGEPQVHLATLGQQLVGFVGYDRSRDPKTKPTVGEIWAQYVLPEHWGKGAGLALWDAAQEGLVEEGCTHVTVWVPLRNERALRFYELAGFKRELNTARTTPVGGVKLEEIRLKRALG
jgi:ribosomal protein S18 acetylase RimI-like enzyme